MQKFLVIILLFLSLHSSADSDADKFGILSYKMIAGFECSTLAQSSNNNEEAERLFQFGHDSGTQLLQAAANGQITDTSKMPVNVSLFISDGGPSVEFILGRMFDHYFEASLKGIKDALSESIKDDKEMQTMMADKLFRERNCLVVGR